MKRITFLIGNGFDINVGLKTSYKDFYQYYIEKYPEDMIAKAIKQDENLEFWSDLEVALGKFTSEVPEESEDDFMDSIDLMEIALSLYLLQEEQRISISSDKKKIISDELIRTLTKFYVDLPDAHADLVLNRIRSLGTDLRVSFITFNYTNTLEKCLETLGGDQKISTYKDNGSTIHSINVGEVVHIHGTKKNGMVVGVNDKTQITNERFRNNELFSSCLIKKENNNLLGYNRTKKCQQIINESSIICLFGLSLGETDKMWWSYLISWLSAANDRLLLIFQFDATLSDIFTPHQLFEKQFAMIDKLKNYADNSSLKWDQLTRRIIISINSKMFDFKLVK